ncbi:MAG: hypothetical protein AAFN27_08790 [Pseudomonadota bacterium]
MVGRPQSKELATLDERVADDLRMFNRHSVQRIVDHCNAFLEDKESAILDESKSYGSFYKALNGEEIWIGMVEHLEELHARQASEPFEYITEPGDDLHAWMKEFAKADWWYDLLDLDGDISDATFKRFFSSGKMSKKNLDLLRERFDERWTRMKAALDIARDYADWCIFDDPHDYQIRGKLEQRLFELVVEDQTLARDDVMQVVEEKYVRRWAGHLTVIDPRDPKDPFVWGDYVGESVRNTLFLDDEMDEKVRDMIERDFSNGRPSLPPDGEWERSGVRENQWGSLMQEEGTTVKNDAIWDMHYREEFTSRWDRRVRGWVEASSKIVAVSRDGETWREPDEREAQGWFNGVIEKLEAYVEGRCTLSPYEQIRQHTHKFLLFDRGL